MGESVLSQAVVPAIGEGFALSVDLAKGKSVFTFRHTRHSNVNGGRCVLAFLGFEEPGGTSTLAFQSSRTRGSETPSVVSYLLEMFTRQNVDGILLWLFNVDDHATWGYNDRCWDSGAALVPGL